MKNASKKYDNDVVSHRTMINILNDLSPFDFFYIYIFFLGLLFSILYDFSDSYLGIFPFSRSMIATNDGIRFFNDFIISYISILIVLIFFRYLIFGLSDSVKFEFKRAAKNPNRNRLDKNISDKQAKKQIIYTAWFVFFIVIFWIWIFGFTGSGNSPIMRNFLESHLFTYCFFSAGFFLNLYLIISSIFLLEGVKHVVFLR